MSQGTKLAVGLGGLAVVLGGGYYLYSKGVFSAHAVDYTPPTPNATGGTVTLTAPEQVTLGQSITVTAQSSGITDPVYNFFFGLPGATGSPKATSTAAMSGWSSTGYGPEDTASTPATVTGAWSVIVYARSASAPANELQAGDQSQYEADSGGFTVQVVS